MPPTVRAARPADVPAIAAAYGHAVRTGVATFDLTEPPPDHWTALVVRDAPGEHVLVVEDGGDVRGYAYSTTFRPRPGYGRTRETSIYLAPDAVGRGLGRTLYRALLAALEADDMHRAVAVVALPNPASVALHESLGFTPVGTLHEVGRKFDRWVDTRWYERPLAP